MIATIIMIALAFVWLAYETDYMQVRLPVGKAPEPTAQADNSKIMPEDTPTLKPVEFTPLDMPEFTGSLNIVCERG